MDVPAYKDGLGSSNLIPPAGLPVAYYDYLGVDGSLLFQVIRYRPKDFRTRRSNGSGGWTWGLAGLEPTIYRLPEVMQASTIVVFEGEKDVHTALWLGLPLGWAATTSPFGAGKWRSAYSDLLRGKKVILCPDTDLFGQVHLKQMIFSLLGKASEILIVRLPDSIKDLSEWVDQGGDSGRFADLLLTAQDCPYPLSDEERMHEIRSLDDALARIQKLQGVSFEWISPESQGELAGPQLGFVAQEVEPILPQWIGIDGNGFGALCIRGFEALVVESMREIKARSDHLDSRIDELRAVLSNRLC